MTLHSLPLFVRLAGRPVILLGEGPAADAKRRLLDRAGATIVGEDADAALAIVAIEDDATDAQSAIDRLKARGVLVNAVDRPALCDFTLPAIVERDPVLIAVATGGASAGLAAALRQRLETLLPARLGDLARALFDHRDAIRRHYPDATDRRRALGVALAADGALDPLAAHRDDAVERWLARGASVAAAQRHHVILRSDDPDDLTLRETRLLAQADRIEHDPGVPTAILDRARADADRVVRPVAAEAAAEPGSVTIVLERAP